MKCVCGYEYEYDWNSKKNIKGDKKFIRITTIRDFETDENIGDYYTSYLKGGLYICPKCGTVRFEENY